ncbi:hypothetical protein BACEGG_00837 [Bacteroides eggerthii DSM 20697]|nr:hypothetical protein BACEGG_00837 [Bacteroides eggerthii DSM 20697]
MLSRKITFITSPFTVRALLPIGGGRVKGDIYFHIAALPHAALHHFII